MGDVLRVPILSYGSIMHFIATIFAFLRRLVVALVTICIIVFIASNREVVALTFFPLPYTWHVPLYVPSFLMGAAGLIVGFLLAATPVLPERFRTWRDSKKLRAEKDVLAGELAILKMHMQSPQSTLLPYHMPSDANKLRPASELFSNMQSS